MRKPNKTQPRQLVLNEQDYTDFRNAITTLWQAQAMAEIIAETNVEEIDSITLQTAVRGIGKFVLESVMALEEMGVPNA